MNNKFVISFVIVTGLFLGVILRDGCLPLEFKFECLFFLSCFALLLFVFEEYTERYRIEEEAIGK
jgi:hypothetical protein